MPPAQALGCDHDVMQPADAALPDVHFSSTSDDGGGGGGDVTYEVDDADDVVFIAHLPAAKRRCDHQFRSASLRASAHRPALQADGEVVTREGALHAPQAAKSLYSFTHYRRCSADVASALKAKDGSMLMTILASLRHHSAAHPPPIPSHKLRERLALLASPTTLPPFLSSAVVCSAANAIQELWSSNAGAALPRTARKAKSGSKSKTKIKGKTKVKTKGDRSKKVNATRKERKEIRNRKAKESKKRKSAKIPKTCDADHVRGHQPRWHGMSKEERRAAELSAGYVPCDVTGCARTFTSLNSMLSHLRDKHHVLDPRMGKNLKATPQHTDAVACSNAFLDSMSSGAHSEQPPQPAASPAPLPPIASVPDDSVGARLMRLAGWTGGGLGPSGAGIAGAWCMHTMRCCCSGFALSTAYPLPRLVHPAKLFTCIAFNVAFPHSRVSLEPVNPIVSFKRRGLGSLGSSGTTVEQVQQSTPLSLRFSAPIHCRRCPPLSR